MSLTQNVYPGLDPRLATLLDAALKMYAEHGWLSIPLENDANGLPKKPFTNGWRTAEEGSRQ